MKHHTLFISDLHLDPSTPDQNATFLHFLNTLAPQADALYILGDFFDVWIGDDHRTPFSQQIIDALLRLSQTGVPTYFMRGNRDFLLGKQFAKASGLTLLADTTSIDLYGKPTLLMHGDSLCPLDSKHQKFRRFVNKRFHQKCMLATPLAFRQWVAKRMRHQSRHHQSTLNDTIMDVTAGAVNQAFKQSGAELLIHGHTHRPAIHAMQINEQSVTRAVLGAWHRRASILRYDEHGQLELIELRMMVDNGQHNNTPTITP